MTAFGPTLSTRVDVVPSGTWPTVNRAVPNHSDTSTVEAKQSSKPVDVFISCIMPSCALQISAKLRVVELGRRMTFRDAIEYANDHLTGEVRMVLSYVDTSCCFHR